VKRLFNKEGKADGRLEMDFPAHKPRRIDPPKGLIEAIGATPTEVWAAQFLLAVFETPAQIRALVPDLDKIKPISSDATQGRGNLICAAPGEGGYDVISRFFAPGSGIPEDPATGSAHCVIAPLYAERLGKTELKCFQAYPGRGADITTRVEGDRVKLIGRARTVIEGVFHM
jgi:predicted PhzF superfamily epimerase YddE/YHI9